MINVPLEINFEVKLYENETYKNTLAYFVNFTEIASNYYEICISNNRILSLEENFKKLF